MRSHPQVRVLFWGTSLFALITGNTAGASPALSAAVQAAKGVVPTARQGSPDTHYWVLIGLLAVLCVFFLFFYRRMQTRYRALGLRLTAALSTTFEHLIELDLAHQIWYEYYVLDGLLEKTAVPEPLPRYAEHFIRDKVYREDAEAVRALLAPDAMRECARGGKPASLEFRTLTPAGEIHWCRLHMLAVGDESQPGTPLMLSITDIHQAQQATSDAYKAMAEALQNAERSNRVKTEFMSRISHELRTPLNAIMGFLAIARQTAGQPEKLAYSLQRADEASVHLLALVKDILDISAIDGPRMQLDIQPFDLRDMLGDLGTVVFAKAGQNGVALTIHLEGVPDEMLLGDRTRLQQALLYLADNAIKFTPRGGHTSLTAEQTACRDDVAYLRFTIRDDGIGMDEQMLGRLFNPFEQAESASTRRYEGAGLGLPLVKNIVETMGGTIRVQSHPGEGTAITLTVPLALARTLLEEHDHCTHYASLRALVVDNRNHALQYAVQLFQKIKIPCESAVSGDVALRKAMQASAEQKPFDVICISWSLTGMSAFDTVLKLHEALGDTVRLIAIFEPRSEGTYPEAAGLPLAGCLQRPVRPQDLLDLLVATDARAVHESPLACKLTELAGNRVLLAEDNGLNREIAGALLEELGLRVDTAENGQEAFQRYLESKPGDYQAVLMDIQMPVMDGYDATRAIRASARTDAMTIPIIALTANAFPEDVTRSLDSGMNDHLSKPIDLNAIRSSLQKQLSPPVPQS